MILFLNDICTILKPTFDDKGEIVFENFGDCFCLIKRGTGDRYLPQMITHKAIIEMNGAKPGDLLITSQHDYLIVSVNKQDNILGLVVQA